MSDSRITVIVPTYNRAEVLLLCLAALEAQTMRDFDVIVVNDGSTDNTEEMLAVYARATPLRLRVLSQENAGPARGRNLAISQTQTPLVVLIGDDILGTPTFVDEHLRFHEKHQETDQLALGWTKWDTIHQQITPFMRWYEKIQFSYDGLLAGAPPDWQHAYASNLSFKTELFRRNPFDERFRYAAWEDSELAYRLAVQGHLQLTFLEQAVAMHVHPTTFPQAINRIQTLGRMKRLFRQTHPTAQFPDSSGATELICSALANHPWLLAIVTTAVDRFLPPGKAHSMVLRAHYKRTYREID
jgi:glycosyltransferase involved in cell wall biosynthesis